MIKFIIYEKEEKWKNSYEISILNFIGKREEKFKIFNYDDEYSKDQQQNIYILSSNKIEEVLDKAKDIRNNNDWTSQIIIISHLKNVRKQTLINKLLILDYIDIKDNIKERLKEALYYSYNILNRKKTLNCSINGEINKIPYTNILYIEKGNNQNYCTIHTIDEKCIIKDTINNLEKKLDSAYFMKTHRSCIVNLYNIKYYKPSTNTIYFDKNGNQYIDLIAREKRKIFKEKLINNKIIK